MSKEKKDKKKKDKKHKKKKLSKENSIEIIENAQNNSLLFATKCKQHPSQTLTLFCEACHKCICIICQERGVHHGISHPCQSIQKTYQIFINQLNSIISQKLNAKEHTITQEIVKINCMIQNIRSTRLNLEIETRQDLDGILQRLRDEESRKLSILNVDLHNLTNILQEIENINISTKSVNDDKHILPMIEFLTNYDILFERATILSSKHIKKEYNIDCKDFPHEIECRKIIINNYNKVMNDHSLKDKFIDYMLYERQRLLLIIEKQNTNISEIENATKEEMKHWMQLTDRFVQSLDSFKLKCAHCGIPLHQQSVNSFCDLNTNVPMIKNSNKNEQEFGSKGSSLHYFVPFN